MDASLTEKIEECLEFLYKCEKEGKNIVRMSEVSKALEMSPSSTTSLLRKMADMELVLYESYKGVRLTEKGRKIAKNVVRKHRLSERLLTDLLGMDWAEVHEHACRLEHAISDKLADIIEEKLGYPETCPHGHPISGDDPPVPDVPLSEVEPPAEVEVTRIMDESPAFLRRLSSIGILPGSVISVEDRAPLGGALLVRVLDTDIAIGKDVAPKIRVRLLRGGHRHRHRHRWGWK